jgi:hypothetical protein
MDAHADLGNMICRGPVQVRPDAFFSITHLGGPL